MKQKIYLTASIIVIVGLLGISIKSYIGERKARIRMSENFYETFNDLNKHYNLKLSEFKKLKKENNEYVIKIDSLQQENKIKDRHINSAENIILSYRHAEIKEIIPVVDTIYVEAKKELKNSLNEPEKIIRRKYHYNDGCICFNASVNANDPEDRLIVDNAGFNTDISIIDYTRRKKSWFFGLRLGKKEDKIVAKSDCGEINVIKYERIRK